MTLTEKTAYIKGLMEGLDFKADTPEKKILAAVIDLLDDVAIAVTEAEEDIEYLNDYVEELDSDLGDVESDIYECDDDEDEDFDDEDDDDDYYEAVCPSCGEVIYLDDDLLECDDILCPKCGEKLICELDDCDCCDADCCDGCDK
jgi:hypothetical protein